MTTNTSSFLKRFGISVIAGALLLAASPAAPGSYKVSLDQAGHPVRSADAATPSIFHPWGKAVLADLDPSIFHPWSTHLAVVADIDPSIFHPWGGATRAVAELGPDIFHPWGKAGLDVQLS